MCMSSWDTSNAPTSHIHACHPFTKPRCCQARAGFSAPQVPTRGKLWYLATSATAYPHLPLSETRDGHDPMSYPLLYETSPPIPADARQPSRSASFKSKLYADKPEAPNSTLFDLFQSSVKAHASQPALGYRPIDDAGKPSDYKFYTYQETEENVQAVASALHHSGVQKGQRVAVYGQNSCEWMIILQVCQGHTPRVVKFAFFVP